MRVIKSILAWTYVVIMFIATIPIHFVLYNIAANETFTGDPVPKYYTRFLRFLIWPLEKIEKK